MPSVFSLNVIWKYMIAHSLTLLLFFMGLISLSIPMTGEMRPYLILMPIYYWAIYRPTLMQPIFIFSLGMLYDLVLGFPLGLHSILYIACFWLIKSQRLYFMGQGYHMTWIGFCLTCISVLILEYIFFSLKAGIFLNFSPIIYTSLISFLFYPLVSFLLIGLGRLLPSAPKASLSVE